MALPAPPIFICGKMWKPRHIRAAQDINKGYGLAINKIQHRWTFYSCRTMVIK